VGDHPSYTESNKVYLFFLFPPLSSRRMRYNPWQACHSRLAPLITQTQTQVHKHRHNTERERERRSRHKRAEGGVRPDWLVTGAPRGALPTIVPSYRLHSSNTYLPCLLPVPTSLTLFDLSFHGPHFSPSTSPNHQSD
jgi:hypothetical protein